MSQHLTSVGQLLTELHRVLGSLTVRRRAHGQGAWRRQQEQRLILHGDCDTLPTYTG